MEPFQTTRFGYTGKPAPGPVPMGQPTAGPAPQNPRLAALQQYLQSLPPEQVAQLKAGLQNAPTPQAAQQLLEQTFSGMPGGVEALQAAAQDVATSGGAQFGRTFQDQPATTPPPQGFTAPAAPEPPQGFANPGTQTPPTIPTNPVPLGEIRAMWNPSDPNFLANLEAALGPGSAQRIQAEMDADIAALQLGPGPDPMGRRAQAIKAVLLRNHVDKIPRTPTTNFGGGSAPPPPAGTAPRPTGAAPSVPPPAPKPAPTPGLAGASSAGARPVPHGPVRSGSGPTLFKPKMGVQYPGKKGMSATTPNETRQMPGSGAPMRAEPKRPKNKRLYDDDGY